MLAQQMPFAAVARVVGESAYRVMAVCERYVHLALSLADFSDLTALAIDETSRSRESFHFAAARSTRNGGFWRSNCRRLHAKGSITWLHYSG